MFDLDRSPRQPLLPTIVRENAENHPSPHRTMVQYNAPFRGAKCLVICCKSSECTMPCMHSWALRQMICNLVAATVVPFFYRSRWPSPGTSTHPPATRAEHDRGTLFLFPPRRGGMTRPRPRRGPETRSAPIGISDSQKAYEAPSSEEHKSGRIGRTRMDKLDRILESFVAKGEKPSGTQLLGAALVVVNKDGERRVGRKPRCPVGFP